MYLLRYFYIERPAFLLENRVHSGQSIEKFMQNFHLLKVILACLHPSISTSTARDQSSPSLHLSSSKYLTMYSMYNSRENLQHYSTSHENSSMLGSINLEIYLSHQNLSQIKKKICKLKQFSNNSRTNSSMLDSINLEINLSR